MLFDNCLELPVLWGRGLWSVLFFSLFVLFILIIMLVRIVSFLIEI